ncbi:hypothetical protein AB0H00_11915 [Nocardia sp. NPDC023852]|uniref:hypothetical protein n=1 Tax=Nocardia sp. NPDC023852 TaxID=3154697 RepID=UPI0033D0F1C7
MVALIWMVLISFLFIPLIDDRRYAWNSEFAGSTVNYACVSLVGVAGAGGG